jgi:hypothetical protein
LQNTSDSIQINGECGSNEIHERKFQNKKNNDPPISMSAQIVINDHEMT